MDQQSRFGMNMLIALGVTATMSLSLTSAASADVIYVDDSATGGGNSGVDWSNAFINLQDALAGALSGDEIRIAQGIYKPAAAGGPRTIAFTLVNGASMQGGYAGVGAPNPDALDPAIHLTTLSGDLNGDDGAYPLNFGENSYSVVIASAVNNATALRGVRITGGYANDHGTCNPSANDGDRGGGVRLLNAASPVIENCTFIANAAVCSGGAASFHLGTPTFRDCLFTDNHMTEHLAGFGAGSALSGRGDALIENCRFIDNGPAEAGGAVALSQGGLLRRCRFKGNHANDGGALHGDDFAAVECVFLDNSADTGGGAVWGRNAVFTNCAFLGNQSNCIAGGSAITNFSSGGMRIINCLFSGNGGATALDLASVTAPSEVVNCTFVSNSMSAGSCGSGAGLRGSAALTRIVNCIFWDNATDGAFTDEEQLIAHPATLVANNIIQGYDGTPGGANNSGDDPQFIDANGPDNIPGTIDDNPRLGAASPARDAGDDAHLPADAFDLDGDGDTRERHPLDLDGRDRSAGTAIDLGAFEFQTCAADISPIASQGDGAVNVMDLLNVIQNWGACPQPCPAPLLTPSASACAADIVPNCAVDVSDLLAVIVGWGVCE